MPDRLLCAAVRSSSSIDRLLLLAFAAVAVSACGSGPKPLPADAEKVLTEAEAMLASGNAAASCSQLEAREKALFPRRIQDRYVLCLARSLRAIDEPWRAFETLRHFADDFPHSDLRSDVIALEWDLGRTMSRSTRGFLFFWSERTGGRTCLVHLITRYPDNPWLADALKQLADMAYEDQDWAMAEERYRDLLRRRPDSEWVPYARFRFAMSIVSSLHGAEYDLEQMQLATKELDAFLAKPPENQEFVATAAKARERLLDWQAERQLGIARFYQTVGNQPGYLRHLQLACTVPFEKTPSAGQARDLLAAQPAAVTK
jgi:tetratricopeptide (TPR) repeat protein